MYLSVSQRQKVEDYLRLHCIQQIIDDVLNEVIDTLPKNPYTSIARLVETKSRPEFTDVSVYSLLTGAAGSAVEVAVHTNLGRFSGRAIVQGPAVFDNADKWIDAARALLLEMDPSDSAAIDISLLALKTTEAEVPILRALSIACCRASARQRGISLYKYISDLAGGCEMSIPMPIVTVLSMAAEQRDGGASVHVQVIPTQTLSIADALEAARTAAAVVKKKLTRISSESLRDNCAGIVDIKFVYLSLLIEYTIT